ncbi:MAG: hypothetical protein CTY31_08070 [Hyphomicrobium sp.]|nr:MAG: hypothetical protein CTY39_02435 [Hyphomicrobium sp.]PPC99843.1 MAG: hypothetical protein CTY31_08070 [Hyphomicrobium sp.]
MDDSGRKAIAAMWVAAGFGGMTQLANPESWYFQLLWLAAFASIAIGLGTWFWPSLKESIWPAVDMARAQPEPQHEAPERISIVDLAALAQQSFGWNLDASGWEVIDLNTGLKHAANDGFLKFDGKTGGERAGDPFRRSQILFQPIEQGEWRLHSLQVTTPGLTYIGVDNFDVTASGYSRDAPRYYDLHVSDRRDAIAWLKHRSGKFRGAAKAAYDEGETRRRSIFGPAEYGEEDQNIDEATVLARIQSMISPEAAQPTLAKQRGVYINFRPQSAMALIDSFNVSSLTDSGKNDYTIGFARDFETDNITCTPIGNTPRNFEIPWLTKSAARVVFFGEDEPSNIGLWFQEVRHNE